MNRPIPGVLPEPSVARSSDQLSVPDVHGDHLSTPLSEEQRKLVSANISALVNNSHKKQVDIAREAGISDRQLRKIMKNEVKSIPLATLQRIATALDVTEADFLKPLTAPAPGVTEQPVDGFSIYGNSANRPVWPERQQRIRDYINHYISDHPKVNQKTLADTAKVDRTRLNKFLTGKSGAEDSTVDKIATAIGRPVRELTGEEPGASEATNQR